MNSTICLLWSNRPSKAVNRFSDSVYKINEAMYNAKRISESLSGDMLWYDAWDVESETEFERDANFRSEVL